MYKAIGFDLGGVIVEYAIPQELVKIAAELEVGADVLKQAYAELRPLVDTGKISNDAFWNLLVTKSGSLTDPAESRHLWAGKYIEENPFIPGMLDLVDELKTLGYKVGLFSNIDPERGEISKTRGIFEHFDCALLSYEVGVRKPDAAAWKILCETLAVEPGQLVFVDDLSENVDGAKQCGITAIEFVNREQLLTKLKRLGTKL